jgi:hypothetical protein
MINAYDAHIQTLISLNCKIKEENNINQFINGIDNDIKENIKKGHFNITYPPGNWDKLTTIKISNILKTFGYSTSVIKFSNGKELDDLTLSISWRKK